MSKLLRDSTPVCCSRYASVAFMNAWRKALPVSQNRLCSESFIHLKTKKLIKKKSVLCFSVYRQGDIGTSWYAVLSGSLDVKVSETSSYQVWLIWFPMHDIIYRQIIKQMEPGDGSFLCSLLTIHISAYQTCSHLVLTGPHNLHLNLDCLLNFTIILWRFE